MKHTIRVTQEDIDHGRRQSSCLCPVALSTARIVGRECQVNVLWVTVYDPGRTVPTPEPARAFITMFDAHGPSAVKPFEFELEIP